MKTLLILTVALLSLNSVAGTSMKLEGSCSAESKAGLISFNYYSNFDGCKEVSSAAISFSSGVHSGLLTGKRSFKAEKDIYSFKVKERNKNKELVRLTFNDSTGNTSGILRYVNENNKIQTIEVQCEVRDYEYLDC